VRGPDGRPERLVGSLSDISEQRWLEERLRANAMQDELTGLPNRRLFADHLEHARQLHQRDGTPFAVVFFDIDRFKAINDSLGHQVGDRLLTAVGRRLAEAVRGVDTVARFGGDEFAALLHGTERADVLMVVERLQRAMDEVIVVGEHEFVVSASAGVATSDAGYADVDDVLRDADTAMYHAKSTEPGSVAFFDASMHADALRRLRLTGELRRALAEDEFELHYQPIVALADGRADRFEALVRWRHPERGLVPPGEFLPVLVETGLIVRLGRWVIAEVCRQLAEWGPDVACVAVNLSDREFWSTGLLEYVQDCLRRHGLTANRLTLEITEDVVMHRPEAAQRLMAGLHEAGFELHIDDFGTGYSSLESLHRFPVDALKVDRSFVAGIGQGDSSDELVRAIIAMGSALGLDVIAEGVEDEEQVAFLRATGCCTVQGYYFAKPLPPADVPSWLERTSPALRRPA
jgi:diguanylate cyclase (GGDEF)-like protein